MESAVLSDLEFYAGGKLAVGKVTQRILTDYGCTMDEADGIIQRMMSIEGVEGACLFKETDECHVRASLRGRSYVNMAKAATQFGGGGHLLAAGCSFNKSLQEASDLLIPVLIEAINAKQ
jgi:phosphoesterase RecJ-like protein